MGDLLNRPNVRLPLILALLLGVGCRYNIGVLDSYLEFVLAHQESDGGFPYRPAEGSVQESTAFCLLALDGWSRAAGAIERGLSYLLSLQTMTGGWLLFRNDTRSSAYATALSLLVLKRLGREQNRDRIERAIRFLENARHYVRDETLDEDVWGWSDRTYIGAEPTAAAALALKHFNALPAHRAQEAERFFQDTACASGGWTYGYPVDREERRGGYPQRALLVPQLHLTALVLLGMQDKKEEFQGHLKVIQEQSPQSYCPLSLSLSALALDCYRLDNRAIVERLNKVMAEDRQVSRVVFYNALGALAELTKNGRNPLCLDR